MQTENSKYNRSLQPKSFQALEQRILNNQLRSLKNIDGLVDFSSNDYIGFARNSELYHQAHQLVLKEQSNNGSTGSRLLTGNSVLAENLETFLQSYHNVEGALLFNSGYNANLGLFSTIATKTSIVLYDEYIHASIREGLRLSYAKAYKFKHNSIDDLEQKLIKYQNEEVFVSLEAVYSMDGDMPDLQAIANLCEQYGAFLIIDEAHYFGTIPLKEYKHYEQTVGSKAFARLVTYGKAIGAHGACVLGSKELKQFLINFSRSLIYTTALSPHSVATIQTAYQQLATQPKVLQERIQFFQACVNEYHLENYFTESRSPIQCCITANETARVSNVLKNNGFAVLPIFAPTVPKGQERLRFCIHTHNTEEEIHSVLACLSEQLNQ